MSFFAPRPKHRTDDGLEAEKLLIAMLMGLFIAYGWLLTQAAIQGNWVINLSGAPVALDFTAFWEAARLALEGKAASAYDWHQFEPRLVAAIPVRPEDGKFPFFYPPSFFLFITPLGALPYIVAAALWIVATLAAYLVSIRAIWGERKAVLCALAAPAALWCVSIGQNGLLTAALIGGALALLDRRPFVAGVLIGLLAYKPHFGVLLPLVLIATARWRVFMSATMTIVLTTLVSGVLFGWAVFPGFIDAIMTGSHEVLVLGHLSWDKMQSIYGLLRFLGFGETIAASIHGTIAIATAAILVILWRSKISYDVKAASLALGMLVVSPYSFIYDLPILSVAGAFLMRSGQLNNRIWEVSLVLSALILPIFFPIRNLPLGPFVYALMGIAIFLRIRDELGKDFLKGSWWVRWESNPGQLD